MAALDLAEFVNGYYDRFAQALQAFDKEPLADVLAVFDEVTAQGGTVWVAGNGGSAAIANHTVCDCSKGTFVDGKPPLRTVSSGSCPSGNAATFTDNPSAIRTGADLRAAFSPAASASNTRTASST